jgi:peptidoglycan hydrolase-like protein with peptidoglycan-binding domain
MFKTGFVPAGLALAGFVALAGCSSSANHPMTQNSTAPVATAAAAPVAAFPPEVSPALIKRIQTTLRQQGFYKGRIDGVWGPETQSGIHGYQQSHNLTNNGELDSQTLASLKTDSVGSAAPATPPATVATAPTTAPATSTTN